MAKKKKDGVINVPTYLNFTQVKELTKANFRQFIETGTHVPLCLWGVKGVGKTTVVNLAAKELGEEMGLNIGVVQLALSTLQPFSLNGYPYLNDAVIGDRKVRVQSHAVPEFLARSVEYDYLFVFLDEMNRARPEMHNSVMGLLDRRGIGEHPIPKNVFVISANNPDNEDYAGVTSIEDEAFLDRVFHINVATSEEETLGYMYGDKTINKAVYTFLNEDRERIQKKRFDGSITSRLEPSDRSYANVGRFVGFIKDRTLQEAAAKGLLGDNNGQLFIDRLNRHEALFTVEEILDGWDKTKAKTIKDAITPNKKGESRLDVVSRLNDTIVVHLGQKDREELTTKQINNLKKYMEIIPHDHRTMIATKGKFKSAEAKQFAPQLNEALEEGNLNLTLEDFR
jgi:hypothetical protein